MTLFEYLAIAFSLVFSFAAMRLVGGLPHALASERRYWVHIVLVLLQLLATAAIFWIFWSYREVEWTFPRFLLVLSIPILVYINACALIPEAPASVANWRDYYFSVCRRYFIGVAIWTVLVAVAGTFVLGLAVIHPIRVPQIIFLTTGIVGASTANPRVHAGIALCFLITTPIMTLLLLSAPGSLR
jgi:hypothetical protein